MSEIERIVQEALKTDELNLTFEGVKNEVVKLSMEIHGERKGTEWDLHVRLGNGTTWSPERHGDARGGTLAWDSRSLGRCRAGGHCGGRHRLRVRAGAGATSLDRSEPGVGRARAA